MQIVVARNRAELGSWVAGQAAAELCKIIAEHGDASLLVATGSSQFEVLDALCRHDEVPWDQVTGFHLDEYVGLSPDHPASFCRYLRERFVDRVTLKRFHFLRGDGDSTMTASETGERLHSHGQGRPPIDVALVGIGENGHLAFNDPPADFETKEPYLVVRLDAACRRQQVGEGWFSDIAAVPEFAISMSIHQIMQSARIFCSVPDERKAEAVQRSVEGPVTPLVPASILRTHGALTLVVDLAAASMLSRVIIDQAIEL